MLRRRRQRIKSTENWDLFYYKFNMDHAVPNLIWNFKCREELREVTDRWVEAAFSLGDQDLRRMEQLTAAQRRRRRSAMQAATAL